MKDTLLFDVFSVPVYLDDLLWLTGTLLLFVLIFLGFNRLFLPFLNRREEISTPKQKKGRLLLVLLLILLFVDIFLRVLDVRILIFEKLTLSLIVEALILLVVIYLVLWIATNVFIHRYFLNREKEPSVKTIRQQDPESRAINTVRWLLFSVAIILLLQYIGWDHTFFDIKSPKEDAPAIEIRLTSAISTIIIYLLARLFIWVLTQLILHRYYKRQNFDPGISYSINKLVAYLIYFIATIVALKNLGMDMGLLLGGAAALLVGLGLALQSTFADFFSGLILLFERPITVGDYVTYESKTVQIQKIGLRASKVKDRDSVNYIIPNSKLISQMVVNWSYDEKYVRFQINVGVAYGSDTRLVETLLMQAASEHDDVMRRPKPKVVFNDFGNSSLDFVLNYYSKNIYNSEWVRSDIRFRIDELFRENNITIPFPQRDVWLRK